MRARISRGRIPYPVSSYLIAGLPVGWNRITPEVLWLTGRIEHQSIVEDIGNNVMRVSDAAILLIGARCAEADGGPDVALNYAGENDRPDLARAALRMGANDIREAVFAAVERGSLPMLKAIRRRLNSSFNHMMIQCLAERHPMSDGHLRCLVWLIRRQGPEDGFDVAVRARLRRIAMIEYGSGTEGSMPVAGDCDVAPRDVKQAWLAFDARHPVPGLELE